MQKQHSGNITQKHILCPYGRAVLATLDDLIYSSTRKRHEAIRRYVRRSANPSMRTVLNACSIYDIALEASCTGEAHLLTTKANVIAFASRARTKMMLTEHGHKAAALAEIGLKRTTVDAWTRSHATWPRLGDLVALGVRAGYRFAWYTPNNKYEV